MTKTRIKCNFSDARFTRNRIGTAVLALNLKKKSRRLNLICLKDGDFWQQCKSHHALHTLGPREIHHEILSRDLLQPFHAT